MVLIRIIHRFTTDFVTSYEQGLQVRVYNNRKLLYPNLTLVYVQPHPKVTLISPLLLFNSLPQNHSPLSL